MTASKPTVRVGQEWEKRDNNRMGSTRIRVLAVPAFTCVKVGTVTGDGRVIREREMLMSAFNNAPSGYRLVQDAPAPAAETKEPTQPAPLAKVREALEAIKAHSPHAADVRAAESSLAALAQVERSLAAFLSTPVEQMRALEDAARAYHLKHTTGIGGAAICACGAGNGGSLACNALRAIQRLQEDLTP